MNLLGAEKTPQIIILVVLLVVLAVFDYLWITAANEPVTVPLGEGNFFAQMNYGRIYVDHYGEETVYDGIVEQKAHLQEEYEADYAAAQARLRSGEEVELPAGPDPVSREWVLDQAATLGRGTITATVELNIVEAIIFCTAINILFIYLFNVIFLSRGRSVVESAPDHSA
ncbi:hypothetical protein KAU45_02745 [bacterium]|nr:hypothetical protein [bacterium]